jgi:hypothetical protein
MATLSEWLAGETADGRKLPDGKVAAYRARHGQRTDPPAGSQPSRGLGDTIHNLARATRIDRVVKAVAGNGCGCEKRRKWLNEVFPYGESK